jgi:hypothetical protein
MSADNFKASVNHLAHFTWLKLKPIGKALNAGPIQCHLFPGAF